MLSRFDRTGCPMGLDAFPERSVQALRKNDMNL